MPRSGVFIGLAVMALAGPAAAQSVQAQFEAASAALTGKRYQEAADGFGAIAARPTTTSRTKGIALLRQGQALSSLGRQEDAATTLRDGLALTPVSDATLADDRLSALLLLGGIEIDGYDYVAARGTLERGLKEATTDSDRLAMLMQLVQATMFVDPSAAKTYADEAIRRAPADNKAQQARARDRKGRVLMNAGDLEGARKELEVASALLGGVTTRTNLDDVIVRSDLATTLLLLKRQERARELVAMTGAGRAGGGKFGRPMQFDMTPCGADMRPDDVVVVEFGVSDGGAVFFAQPIYASRPGPQTVEYARTVRSWGWRPDEVKDTPFFFRAATRVELRCSTASERPQVEARLTDAFEGWLKTRKVQVPEEGRTATLAALKAAVEGSARLEPVAQLPALTALARSNLASYPERSAAAERAIAIAAAERAPTPVSTYLLLVRAVASGKQSTAGNRQAFAAILARPDVAADPVSGAVMRLLLAGLDTLRNPASSEAILTQVANDKRLSARDPLRTGALVRLAAVQAELGKLDLARTSYAATGLSAQQCALVDAKPDMKRSGMGSGMYPEAAVLWRTNGWTRAEFDISADGRTLNRRIVAAYPPFVFSSAVQEGLENARYTQSYRPEGTLGCGGMTMAVRFKMPD